MQDSAYWLSYKLGSVILIFITC